MIKCKYSDIKELYDWTEKYADETEKAYLGKQYSIKAYAYYTPSQANWSYLLGIVELDGILYDVVTVFGAIKAIKPSNEPRYNNIKGE